ATPVTKTSAVRLYGSMHLHVRIALPVTTRMVQTIANCKQARNHFCAYNVTRMAVTSTCQDITGQAIHMAKDVLIATLLFTVQIALQALN
ncbi:MAG: hypothetical protein AABZ06_09720, partial [Bdellovibrionota bacterium]